MKAGLLFLFLLLGTHHVFAASTDGQSFTSDASTSFLAVIFGRVSDSFSAVLGTQEKPILAVAFEYYNGFIATIGVVVVSYITVVALANSAHSGTPMGQKWHTLFLPMRVTVGAGMLVPNASGYNLAQVCMMWFILTGVNGADNVWKYVIAEFENRGEQAIAGNTTTIEQADIKKFFTDTLLFAGCVGLAGMNSTSYPPPANSLSLRCEPNPTGDCADSNSPSIRSEDDNIFNTCGQLNINFQSQFSLSGDPDNRVFRSAFMQRLQGNVLAETINFVQKEIALANGAVPADLQQKLQSYLEISLPGMMNEVSSLVSDKARLLAAVGVNYQKEKQIGWMAAGASYYKFIQSTTGSNNDATDYSKIISSYVSAPTLSLRVSYPAVSEVINALANVNLNLLGNGSGDGASEKIQFNPSMPSNTLVDILSIGIRPLTHRIIQKILDTKSLFDYPSDVDILDSNKIRLALAKDPLKSVADKGSQLTTTVETLFFSIIGVLGAAYVASMALSAVPYITTGLAMIIPLIAAVMMALIAITVLFYPLGIIMNIYIPLIPFLIYTFGVIGWLLICVEAMAAGPIVAIGLMHPDGNEVLGKAEQGLMLILNLMLRPVLMIVGLIAAIVVVRVVLLIFSWGMNTVLGSGIMPVESLGAVVGLLFIYVGSIGMLVHKAFGLINQVPDKLMAWIGSTTGGVGEPTEFLQTAERKGGEGGGMPSQVVTQGKSGFSQGLSQGRQATRRPAGPGGGGGGVE